MKKMKLFLTGMLAACVAVGGVNAAEQTFEECVADTTKNVCELSSDYTLTADLNITRALTINLNGHTLKSTAYKIRVKDGANVVLDGGNGVLDFNSYNQTRIYVWEGSSLTLDNVTINAVEANDDNDNKGVIGVDASKTLTTTLNIGKNTIINSTDSVVGVDTTSQISEVGSYTNVNIAGKLSSVYNTVTINGHVGESAHPVNVVIEETAEITSSGGAGVYAAGYGLWTFEDGAKVTGKDAISIKSGELTINGGEYHATGNLNLTPNASHSGAELTGSVISITSRNGYAGDVRVVINDGKFVADKGLDLLETTDEATSSLLGLKIKGGEFICGVTAGVPVLLKKATLEKFIEGGTFTGTHNDFRIDSKYVVGENEVVDGVIYIGEDKEALHNVKVALVQPDGQTVNVEGAYRVAAGNKISLTQLFGFDMTDYKDYTITYVVKDAKGNELGRLSASYLKGEDDVYAAAYDDEFAMIDGDVTVEIIFSKNGKVVAPDEPVIPDPDDDKPAESTPGTGSETEEKPEGNPNTLDSLPLYLIGGAVAVLGVAGLGYSIKKKFEN